MTKYALKTAVRLARDAERRIRPDGAWVARTRNQLLKEIRRDAAARRPVPVQDRFKGFVFAFVPRSFVDFVRGPVMAVLSVFGVALGGSLASVSAAERSIPGDLLYPVKLAAEQARLLLEKEPPDQLKLKAEFVERRGEEIKQLAKTNTPQKSQRLKEAAGLLKQDLDAVKTQLHTVAAESSAPKAVEVAKDIDAKSGRLAQTLKEVKEVVPEDVKANVGEVQSAAMNAGVKAVQVLIEKHDDPAVQNLVSNDDLKRAVSEHVQGLEDGIGDTAKKVAEATGGGLAIIDAKTSIGLLPPIASGTIAFPAESLKGSIDQLKAAKASLEETKQLLQADQLGAVKDKLGEAAKAVASAEKAVTSAFANPSPAPLPDPGPTVPSTTTPVLSGAASSSAPSADPGASSTTVPIPKAASSSSTASVPK